MRRLLVALALLLFAAAPALAATAAPKVFDTPQALLQYAYAPYASGNFQDDNDILYTTELNAMFKAADEAAGEDEVGPVDFDVFVNGQDYQLTELKIGDPAPDGQGVKVPVTFKNFDQPQSLMFSLVKEGGGWKISDIESLTPDSTWKLTTLLTPDNSDSTGSGSDSASGDAGSDASGSTDSGAGDAGTTDNSAGSTGGN